MSGEEVEGAGEPFVGFHAFADDTPRDLPQAPARRPMATRAPPPDDRVENPAGEDLDLRLGDWHGRAHTRPGRKGVWAALLVLALVGGSAVALGLGVERHERKAEQSALAAPGGGVQIRVAPASPPLAMAAIGDPVPTNAQTSSATPPTPAVNPALASPQPPKTSSGPDRLALLAAQFPPAHSPSAPLGPVAPTAAPAAAPSVTPAPAVPDGTPFRTVAPATESIPQPQVAALAPSFQPRPSAEESCRYARTRAEVLVCSDPQLAAEDRQVALAYRAAIAAGAPAARLAREQRDWLAARDDAARRSRREVASLYALRLDDLAQWLDDDEAVGLRR